MSNSVIKDAFYVNDYEPDSITTFTNLIATTVNAYKDDNSNHYNLTLGSSSNVNIEALNGVNVYFNPSNNLKLYNSSFSNNVRINTNLLNVSLCNDVTYMYTSNQRLEISGLDESYTTKISRTVFTDSNNFQLIETDDGSGFYMNGQVVISSNLIVDRDIVAYENVALGGNLFAPNLNIYKNFQQTSNNLQTQLAYGFYINEFDQLELIKYDKFATATAGQYNYVISRVVTFGKNIENKVSDLNTFTVMNQFNGVIGSPSNTSSNVSGLSLGITAIAWQANNDKNRIFYTASNVGINTTDPKYWLDVRGDIFSSKQIISMSNIAVGTSNPLAPLHVVGSSFLDGDIQAKNRLLVKSNVGINTVNPQALLHVVGDSIFEGATSLSSNLTVAGTAALSSNLTVAGTAALSSNLTVTGTAALASNLTVTGTAALSSNLTVAGTAALSSNLTVAGTAALSSNLTVAGTTSLSSNLTVAGTAALDSNLTVTGTTSLSSNLTVAGTAALSSNITVAGTAALDSNLTVAGTAALSSNLIVTGTTSLSSNLTVAGTASITGTAALSSNLTVAGTAALSSNLTVAGTAALDSNLTVTGTTSLSSNLTVAGTAALASNLTVAGIVALSNSVNIYGATTLSNSLNVNGITTLSSNLIIAASILPTTNLAQDIGSSNKRFANIWVNDLHLGSNTLYIGDTPFLGTSDTTINIKADSNQTLALSTKGTGHTQIISEVGVDVLATNGTIIMSSSNGGIQLNTVGTNRTIALTSTGANSKVDIAADSQINFSSATTSISGVTTMGHDLTVNSNLLVRGDLTVNGSNFIANVQTVEVKDNIMRLNKGQTGSGVSAPLGAGIEIDRGNGELLYRVVFKESAGVLQMGFQGQESNISSENYVRTYVGENALFKASNLSELTNANTARNNLGLGSTCNVTFSNATLSTVGAAILNVSGETTLSSNVNIAGSTTLSNTVNILGATTLSNTLNVSGLATLSNGLTIYNGTTTLSNAVNISGATTLSNTLNVSGLATLSNGLTIYNGTTTLSNAVNISGETSLCNNLNISGDLNFNGILKQNGAAYIGSQWTNTSNNLYILSSNVGLGTSNPTAAFEVAGSAIIRSNLSVSNVANFQSNVSIAGDLNFNGILKQNGAAYVGSQWSNNSSNVFLLSSNVGLGTSSPAYTLDVAGDLQVRSNLILGNNAANFRGIKIQKNSNGTESYNAITNLIVAIPGFSNSNNITTISASNYVNILASNVEVIRFNSNGYVGIGTVTPTVQLDLSTDGARKLSTSTWTTGSDQRVKLNIEDANIDICYSNIKAINLKRFQWNSVYYPEVDDRNTLGWIAQEVKEVYPKAVSESESFGFSNFLNLNSDIMIKTMYGALKKTMNLIEDVKSDFEAYKATHP